ncbi:Beta-barrel assembly machine subunit BamA [Chishuiella changwenlii]|jgi:outer membrane protein insertion porin family|uniref:Outer membrane protein assembly factor BamA n=1 Tax=Chishuiella changwenlii TaxID=1434701 RepID=A0A1M6YZS2_9FLAO|nr:outer membrane protein assembly factor BamA [Chishuiella changwenlii]GGE87649.1 outer membrane protein assembly factor [Chishuiella changwenlii]SHL23559.1 Beta-barrel assembly machine subunit BamA [Chishuiella changwenlii]
MKKIFWTMCMLGAYMAQAQEVDSTKTIDSTQQDNFVLDYNKAKTFRLKDIIVTGDTKYSKNQIIRYAGFAIGEEIELPGTKVNNAVKKLWRSNIFSDIDLYVNKIEGDQVTLELALVSVPSLGEIKINGVKKSQREDLIKENKLNPGVKITQSLINTTNNKIKDYYTGKGYPNSTIKINRQPVAGKDEEENITLDVDRGERVKIKNIIFEGNKNLTSARLRKKGLKNTKRKSINIFKSSKMIPEKFQEDLKTLVDEYKSVGFRNAKVESYDIEKVDDKNLIVKIKVNEGNPYFLGDVTFSGNSIYTSEQLQRIFSYKTGDRYDAIGINKKISGSEKDDDISTLYMDRGYLFARAIPVEKSVKNDTIDLEIKVFEGTQATLNKVTINGNTEAHDHILYRELRTKPGDLFSKSDIKRTMMELAGLGYLEPTQIVPDIQPNQENNTVDVEWKVAPKSSSQVELQGGYGAGTFIGTLGLTFGNFSIKNIFNRKAWRPVPMGDGQQLSLRAQAGNGYKNYSFSFVEPWIGGKRPTALSTSVYYSQYNYRDQYGERANLDIIGGTVGLTKLLTWPDDYFRLSNTISYQRYNFDNYSLNVGNLNYENGSSNNLNYTLGLTRNSAGPDPIFPQSGSEISLSFTTTFPYSAVNKRDYANISDVEKFKWLEYYKFKAKAYFYKELTGKLVLKAGGEFGVLGTYNRKIGTIPFERFYLGGTGLMQNRFDGREIVSLRGYEDATNSGGQASDITPEGGGTIYNKYSLELRYPITMSQTAKIYALTFAEGGNVWNNTSEFKPFELKRSAGLGVRIFMPAFGLLGFDFGYGFDKGLGQTERSGWQTHFIIGQQF